MELSEIYIHRQRLGVEHAVKGYTLDDTISRDTRDCRRGRDESLTAFGALLRIEAKKSSFVTATE